MNKTEKQTKYCYFQFRTVSTEYECSKRKTNHRLRVIYERDFLLTAGEKKMWRKKCTTKVNNNQFGEFSLSELNWLLGGPPPTLAFDVCGFLACKTNVTGVVSVFPVIHFGWSEIFPFFRLGHLHLQYPFCN